MNTTGQINTLGIYEKNKIFEYYNFIKNNKTQTKYYMLTFLRNEMTDSEIINLNNYLIDKCNVKKIKIKYLTFNNNYFLLFIMELNDDNNQIYKTLYMFDIINIISEEHYEILLNENNNDSLLLKTAYLYSIKKLIYS